jgi:hypothetical protein
VHTKCSPTTADLARFYLEASRQQRLTS